MKNIINIKKFVPGIVSLTNLKELLVSLGEKTIGLNNMLKVIFRIVTTNNKVTTVSKMFNYNSFTNESDIELDPIMNNIEEKMENYSCEIKEIVLSILNFKNITWQDKPVIKEKNLTPPLLGEPGGLKEIDRTQKYLEKVCPVYDKEITFIEKENGTFIKNKTKVISYGENNGVKFYNLIDMINNKNLVLYEYQKENKIIRKFKHFKYEFHISLNENNIKYYINDIKTRKILVKSVVNRNIFKIVTIDIETYTMADGTYIPYAIGYYDGENLKTFYVTDYKDHQEMIYTLFKELLKQKYNGYIFYFHNFSNFDAYFLLATLNKYFKIKINIMELEGQLICFNFTIPSKGGNDIKIKIFDSYRLLPVSLRNLGLSFDVQVKKGFFPYSFVNKNNLFYIGVKPSIKHYKEISKEEYKRIPKENWSLKYETLKYLKADLISLYQIISHFNDYIYNNFHLNIKNYPTLPSLALNIYRSNFYKHNIPIILYNTYKDIKLSYYGGRCEVFIPTSTHTGKTLYYYDVNSLYPFAMLNKMPVGEVKKSNMSNLDNIFGFCFAKIETPDNLYYPILPFKSGGKLIFPLGKFEGWYFSEELKYAKEHGYKIKVIKSYLFEAENIFDGYVNNFYSFKSSSDPANKIIGKLLLNSLYGKFAQNHLISKLDIINVSDLEEFSKKNYIENIDQLDFDKLLVHYEPIPSNIDEAINKDIIKTLPNISIPISSAITSYARIYMHKVFTRLQELGINVYYTDTDSIVVDQPLPEDLVGTDIGKFKLEYNNITEGYFPLPKIYGLKLPNGIEIIKFKGISRESVNLEHVKSLLSTHSINLVENKNFKNYLTSTYIEKDININIQGSHSYNKRERILINGIWSNTKPLKI